MKLKEIFKRLDLTLPKKPGDLPKEALQLLRQSSTGKALAEKARKINCSWEVLLENLQPDSILSPGAHFHSIVIDLSASGFAGILDGKQRLAWFLLFVSQGRLPSDLDLPVVQLNCTGDAETDSEDDHWFINPTRIHSFLRQHWQSPADDLYGNDSPGASSRQLVRDEVIAHFVRRIVRHLSAIATTGRHASESALLALALSRYLPQVKIAEVMRRSEAWVSAACSLGNLEDRYLEALENGEISYSSALLLAEAPTEEERDLLFTLATVQGLHTRSLRVALQFLRLNEGFARRSDAIAKLLKLVSERLVSLKDQYFARLKLIFRNRQPLWQVRFFHKKKRLKQDENLQTGSAVNYRGLLQKLQEAEEALAVFPL